MMKLISVSLVATAFLLESMVGYADSQVRLKDGARLGEVDTYQAAKGYNSQATGLGVYPTSQQPTDRKVVAPKVQQQSRPTWTDNSGKSKVSSQKWPNMHF